ncbi:hypothetical protein EJB05_35860, partial [Eragrostis curvula]
MDPRCKVKRDAERSSERRVRGATTASVSNGGVARRQWRAALHGVATRSGVGEDGSGGGGTPEAGVELSGRRAGCCWPGSVRWGELLAGLGRGSGGASNYPWRTTTLQVLPADIVALHAEVNPHPQSSLFPCLPLPYARSHGDQPQLAQLRSSTSASATSPVPDSCLLEPLLCRRHAPPAKRPSRHGPGAPPAAHPGLFHRTHLLSAWFSSSAGWLANTSAVTEIPFFQGGKNIDNANLDNNNGSSSHPSGNHTILIMLPAQYHLTFWLFYRLVVDLCMC